MHRGLKDLNNFEKKIFQLIKFNPKMVGISQLGFCAPVDGHLQFPIYHLKIGTARNLEQHPVLLIAGIHGLEIIGIQLLLDFLAYILNPSSDGYISNWRRFGIGLHVIPILNPGGVILKTRANPSGVDLMRNAPVQADKAIKFFGGHTISKRLPYYRGTKPEQESQLLYDFVSQQMFSVTDAIIPILDIHSGYGTVHSVWWPYAKTRKPCADDELFKKISNYLKGERLLSEYNYEPQSTQYTTHGDLWDWIYDAYQSLPKNDQIKSKNSNNKKINGSKLLPFTLELGTWSDIRNHPGRIFKKKKIFNPPKSHRQEFIESHRDFLLEFIELAKKSPDFWSQKKHYS